jgi:ribosomal-protein-alanine N-acetyltransferase
MGSGEPPDLTAGTRLESSRLRLDPATPEHVGTLHRLWTHPDVRRFLWDGRVISESEAAEVVTASVESFAARSYGTWVLVPRDDDSVIGFCALRDSTEPPGIELLYGLHPDRWGQGLATEAARTVLRFAFTVIGLDAVLSGADEPNVASLRVIRRLAMTPHVRVPGAFGDILFHRIDRTAFKAG